MPTRGRRTGARSSASPGVKALAEARQALERHRESIGEARRTRDASLEGARDTLRKYKAPLEEAVDGRRDGLQREMRSVDRFDDALEAAKNQTKRAHAARPSKDMYAADP